MREAPHPRRWGASPRREDYWSGGLISAIEFWGTYWAHTLVPKQVPED